MARKPTDIVAPNLRIRESLRQRLEKAAKRHGISINAEMVFRLNKSFEQDDLLTIQRTAQEMARYGQMLHAIRKQSDLLRASQALIDAIMSGNSTTIRPAVEELQIVIALIEQEAVKLMHTTGEQP